MSHRPHLVCRNAAVLVVVDVQERLAAVMRHRARVVDSVGRLLRAADLLGLPVIVTRQNPAGLGGLVPELDALLQSPELSSLGVVTVDKHAFCSCNEPSFTQALQATARRQVVLCGMETHICVAQTALGCFGEDYEVFVAADACCSVDDGDAHIALDRLRADGVEVLTSQAVMYEAAREAGTDEFRRLLSIVKSGVRPV